jgi:RNA polymerase primary sigma factor
VTSKAPVPTKKPEPKVAAKTTRASAKADNSQDKAEARVAGVAPVVSQTTDAAALAAIDTSGYVLPAVKVPGRRGRKPKEFTPENDEVAALNAVERAELKAVDKAKAKDRKAKEKALLKDAFSSDTEASEEELELAAKAQGPDQVGKERGFLTYAEINDHLPENIVDPEAIEGIIGTFNDMGIAVYEHAPDAERCCCPTTSPPSPATTKPKPPPRRRCRPSIPTSAAPPTRSACTCAKWARSSC